MWGGEATGAFTLWNRCAGPLRVDAIELRLPAPAFAVEAPGPLDLGPGDAARVEVRFAPPAPGLVEQILFIDVSAPFVERRPLGLFGRGTP